MSDLTLVTLLGNTEYPSVKYDFGNNQIITSQIYTLALFEQLRKNNNNVVKIVLVGSRESCWYLFYNSALNFIQSHNSKATNVNFQKATKEEDQNSIISRLKELFTKYLYCELIDIVYDSTSIADQNSQATFVENITKIPMTKNIVFDATFGFRFIPWLVFTALEYKTYIDNSSLDKIYYAKVVNKTNNEYKSIELNMSTQLFKEALDLNAYQTTGDLTSLENLIHDQKLKHNLHIANLAENFGCYDIAHEKFSEIRQDLINEFDGSIAFNKDFFDDRLNWIIGKPHGNWIRLSEHFFNTRNYTDCILTAHQFGKSKNLTNRNSFQKLQNDFRTQIIHMIDKENISHNEPKFKEDLKQCLINLTNYLEPEHLFTINDKVPSHKQGVLVSIIGSGNYKLTNYESNEFNLNNVKYFGTSLALELKKQNKIEKLFICGTHTSNWDEFLDSLQKLTSTPSEKLIEFINKHKATIINPNAKGSFDKYYLSTEQANEINNELQILKPELGISVEVFCYDDKEEDSGDFSELLKFTEKKWIDNDFYLDITHGFRSIPFIMFFAFLTICSRKNNVLKNIYYGFSDYNKDPNTIANGWIADETHLLKLIKYSFEINKFNSSGNFLYIGEMLDSLFNHDTEINTKVLTAAMNENLHKYVSAGNDFTVLKNLLISKENAIKDNFVYRIIREPILSAIDLLRNKSKDPIDTYIDRVEFFLSRHRYPEAIFSSYEAFHKLGLFLKSCCEDTSKVSLIGKYDWIMKQYNDAKNNPNARNCSGKTNPVAIERNYNNFIAASLNRGFCIKGTSQHSRPLNFCYYNISNYRRVITGERDGPSAKNVYKIIEKDIRPGNDKRIFSDINDTLECLKMYREFISQFK